MQCNLSRYSRKNRLPYFTILLYYLLFLLFISIWEQCWTMPMSSLTLNSVSLGYCSRYQYWFQWWWSLANQTALLSLPCIIMDWKRWRQWVEIAGGCAATRVVMVPTFLPCQVSPINKVIYHIEDCLLCCCHSQIALYSLEHAWLLMNEPVVLGLALLSVKPPHSALYTCTLYYESAELKFQSVPVIDISHRHSLTDSWCTFMQQFMTLSWLFSWYNKENNKSSVYSFPRYAGYKTGMYFHKVKACATIRATCNAIQYTHMIYETLPSPFWFPSISAATITLSSIFFVLAAWIDRIIYILFRQIINRKHQTTAWPWRVIQVQLQCCHFEGNKVWEGQCISCTRATVQRQWPPVVLGSKNENAKNNCWKCTTYSVRQVTSKTGWTEA